MARAIALSVQYGSPVNRVYNVHPGLSDHLLPDLVIVVALLQPQVRSSQKQTPSSADDSVLDIKKMRTCV
jgi:hypothetical protein